MKKSKEISKNLRNIKKKVFKFTQQKWVLYTVVTVSILLIIGTLIILFNPKLTPNSDIYETDSEGEGIYANSNPSFDVLFGNKEDESAQWTRFESETQDTNSFDPNYQAEDESLLDKFLDIFKEDEKLGIEMSLSGVKLSETSNETIVDISNGELSVDEILGTEDIQTSTELLQVGRNLGEVDTEQNISKETILNENVWKGVDLEYQILEGVGVKEEIIIRSLESYMDTCSNSETDCELPLNEFIFDLQLDKGVELHQSLVIVRDNPVGTYYFTDSKGNYLAHFLPNFAFDEGGSKTNNVDFTVEETDTKGLYKVHVVLDMEWMLDADRIFPIHIDPSIVHDDSTDFSAGILNRLENATGPKIQLVEQELTADAHTVGLWHMNEASGDSVADSSGNSNTGTATGTTITTGKFNNARSFDGTINDYISLSSVSKFPTSAITVEMWMKTSDTSKAGTPISYAVVNENISSTNEFILYNYTNFSIYVKGSIISTGISANDGNWHHIAVTWSSSDGSAYLYKDGVLKYAGVISAGTPMESGGTIVFGQEQDSLGSGFDAAQAFLGLMDEVRIFNIALTAEEIKADAQKRTYGIYTSNTLDLTEDVTSIDNIQWTETGVNTGDGEIPYSTTDLIGQWDFNETSGTTADNEGSCGASCDGTLTNMTTTGQDAAVSTGWTAVNSKWGGGAVMFDGSNDYVNAGTNNALNLTSAITMEAWIKTQNKNARATILSKRADTTYAGYGLGFYDGLVHSYFMGSDGVKIEPSFSSAPISDGKWHHVVATLSETTGKIYYDGVLVSTLTNASFSGVGTNTEPLEIGYSSSTGTGWTYFDGVIDSTKIYSRSLSSSEILSNYNSTNIEFLTRTSTDGSTWEEWKPSTGETQIDDMDTVTCTGANASSGDMYIFTGSGTLTCSESVSADVLVVGGGGAGGSHVTYSGTGVGAGGGGAGGITYTTGYNVSSGGVSVVVGTGGVSPVNYGQGGNGGTSSFGTISVTGGGGGGCRATVAGKAGGSGGGGSYNGAGGSGTSGQGYAGGTGSANNYGAAGGGGAGAVGTNSTTATGKAGGVGKYFGNIFGTSYGSSGWFGGGGGGGGQDGSAAGSGGTGGGGAGGTNADGTSATDGTGGGGGGSGDSGWKGGDGGDGIVIIVVHSTLSEDSGSVSTSQNSDIFMEGDDSARIKTGYAEVDPNTVALWHFEETGGTGAYIQDSSVNNNDGTPTGTTVSDGLMGKARSFDASGDYITITAATSLNVGDVMTISAWIKPTDTSRQTIYSHGSNATGGFQFEINGSGGAGSFGTMINGYYIAYTGGGLLKTGEWNHIAYTRTGAGASTHALYLNGVARTLAVNATNSYTSQTANSLICGRTTGAQLCNGLVDEVRISKTASTANEIYETYRAGREYYIYKTMSSTDISSSSVLQYYIASDKPGTYLESIAGESAYANNTPDTNTVGFWHLEEEAGSGAYIQDSSSYNNDGTPTGATIANGVYGKARSFNGSSNYISVTDSTTLNSSYMTIDAWINPDTLVEGASIYNRRTSGNVGGVTMDTTSAGLVSCYFYISGSWRLASTTTVLPTGKWSYVTCSYDGSYVNAYFNGKKEASTAISGSTISSTSESIWIGRNVVSSVYFDGLIDEVRVSNIARTAEQISQAYEIGSRTHLITIDFGAVLNSGDLITGSSDTGFTIDATTVGLSKMGSNLYEGDKIIVKENYNGTEYIAQGTVTSVDVDTGAVTVSSWDTGATFPSGGYTVSATVFKWQKEYIDLSNIRNSDISALTNISFRILDGNEGRNIWIDDISHASYLSDPAATSNVTSTLNRYIQYRAVISTADTNVIPYISSVTINYTANTGPSMDQIMRHGKWFNSSGVKQNFWWVD